MIPFFLFVPDIRQKRAHDGPPGDGGAVGHGALAAGQSATCCCFLVARMIYTDGLTAIFTFGGIYGASVFGWGALELGLFGIVLTLVGAFGALIGGVLDDRISAKFVIVSALFILLVGAFGILSVDADARALFHRCRAQGAGLGAVLLDRRACVPRLRDRGRPRLGAGASRPAARCWRGSPRAIRSPSILACLHFPAR